MSPSVQQLRGLSLIGAFVAALVLGVWLWFDVLEDRWFPKNWGEVVPGQVFRSGQLSPWLIEQQLRQTEIELIIDLNRPVKQHDQQFEEQTARELGIEHRRFGLDGNGTGEPEHFVDAVVELTRAYRAGRKVLVHCTAGAQRTGGVVAAFELLVLKKTPQQVAETMQHYGWDPQEDLIVLQFVNQHLDEVSQALVEQELIEPASARLALRLPAQ